MAVKLNNWPGTALACGLLLAPGLTGIYLPQAQAAAPQPYGEDFVRLDRQWQDARPTPLEQALPDTDPADSSLYERQVTMLEQQGGPYADALSEPLTGLGRYYLENGKLDEAQTLYRRALHIVRVNDGLYSQRQVPILRALLDSYRLAGDLEGLDDRYEYYFRLYGNGQPPFTPLRLRAAVEYFRWQREALRLGVGDEKQRMLELYQLNEQLLEQVMLDPAIELSWRRELAFSQMRNLYLIQHRFEPVVQAQGYVPSNQYFGAAPQAQGLNDRHLDNIVRSSMSYGVNLLDRLAGASGQAEAAQRAQVTLALADWYQWNNQLNRAAQYYGQVVSTLQQAGENERLQGWLGQPVELPDNGAFWQPTGAAVASPVVVTARYDVSPTGRASNIETETDREADAGKASSLRRLIARTRFRPRFAAGVAEAVPRLERKYEWLAR